MQLKSERLLFKKYSEDDLSIYQSLMMNENVVKYISGRAPTFDATKKRFEYIVNLNAQHALFGFYAVLEKTKLQAIGLAKFVRMDENEAEIGYALSPEYWRKGYGNEITKALINCSKNSTNLKRLIAVIDPENEASFQLLLKNNFLFSHSLQEQDGKISHAFTLSI